MKDVQTENFFHRPAGVKFSKTRQGGQTIIETVVAIFILTMGITAAVGLAIFALSTATSVSKQIIATGLAREGIEAVKNMRDTNWLKISAIDLDCYNYVTGNNDAKCYKKWLNPTDGFNYNLQPPSDFKSYILSFNPNSPLFWSLDLENSKYGLNFNQNVEDLAFAGFYYPSNTSHGNSEYYRRIILRTDGANSASPFNTNIGPRLQVISQVWWTDKKCPRSQEWPGLGKCSVEMQTFLTNWKNY